MSKLFIVCILAFCIFAAIALPELKMDHRKRTPREAKILLEYVNRGPLIERVNKLLTRIFPSALTPNIYAYPEVKIINYLDAQYYG